MADHQMGDVVEMNRLMAGQFLIMNVAFIGKGFYFHLAGMFIVI